MFEGRLGRVVMAVALGAIGKPRGFEPHSRHYFYFFLFYRFSGSGSGSGVPNSSCDCEWKRKQDTKAQKMGWIGLAKCPIISYALSMIKFKSYVWTWKIAVLWPWSNENFQGGRMINHFWFPAEMGFCSLNGSVCRLLKWQGHTYRHAHRKTPSVEVWSNR